MSDKRPNLFMRDDTFFGVCQGISEDLGIPVDLLRVAFLPLLFLAPLFAVATYFGLGLVVLVTHLLIPARPRIAKPLAAVPAAPAETGAAPLPLAA